MQPLIPREFIIEPETTVRSRINFSKIEILKNIKNIWELSSDRLISLLTKVNYHYKKIESAAPAGGYEFHIVNYGKDNKNDVELYFEACETRPVGSEMEMVKAEGCIFCKIKENQLEGASQKADSSARVILSKEKKPLILSVEHRGHFFDLTIEQQVDQILAAKDAVNFRNKTHECYSHIRAHAGIPGHEWGVAHAHTHVDI